VPLAGLAPTTSFVLRSATWVRELEEKLLAPYALHDLLQVSPYGLNNWLQVLQRTIQIQVAIYLQHG
jgi:hypothetical protein